MLSDETRGFIAQARHAVLTTYRGNGLAQMSILSVGPYGDGVAFTSMAKTAKVRNLRGNPRCSLMLVQDDWRRYIVLEGRSEVLSPDNTDRERLRLALREVYRAIGREEHPDWDEYDEVMRDEEVVVVTVVPDRVYGGTSGTALPRRR